jgi:hypothetical protein
MYMLIQTASEKGTGLLVKGRRRRLGAWLLVGWLAYLFTTVAQACCISFSANPGSVGRTPAIHAGEMATHSSGSPMLPSLPDSDCDALSAIGPGAPNAATGTVERLDLPTVAPLASEQLAVYVHAGAFPASNSLRPPTSGVPRYLRNQRLLI